METEGITASMQERNSTETDCDQWRTCTWCDSKGKRLERSKSQCYDGNEWVKFDNKYMRHDIGKAIDEA